MNTMKLIFAVPILLAMFRELDGYGIDTRQMPKEKIGLPEISDEKYPIGFPTKTCAGGKPCHAAGEICHTIYRIWKWGFLCQFTCSKNVFRMDLDGRDQLFYDWNYNNAPKWNPKPPGNRMVWSNRTCTMSHDFTKPARLPFGPEK